MTISAVGCDVGGSSLKALRLEGETTQGWIDVPTPRDRDAFVGTLTDLARELGANQETALGVALPGFLDPPRRAIERLSNLSELDGLPLARELEDRLGARVVLDADTNAGAVGEWHLGAARGSERFLFLSLGTGLGAAVISDGAPLRSSHHTAGHIASIPLPPDGLPAESTLSQRGLARLRRESVDPANLCLLADSGDPEALRVWKVFGQHLASLLHILIPLWNVPRVVVGGGLAGAAHIFLPPARCHLMNTLTGPLAAEICLLQAELGRRAGATGVALLAMASD